MPTPALTLGGRVATLFRSADHRAVLLRGTAGSLLTKAAATGLLFASQIFFARLLGVDGFGR